MKYFIPLIYLLVLLGLTPAIANSAATYDAEINKIYQTRLHEHASNLEKRIVKASEYFLGRPYVLNSQGEGKTGQFDQQPLYRTDVFDCVTYTNTVLALAMSSNLNEFKRNIMKLRYQNGQVNFIHRNHFTSVDWNPNAIQLGLLKDITYKFIDKKNVPIATIADTIINKPQWYKQLSPDRLKLNGNINEKQKRARLKTLHRLGLKTQQEKSTMLYLPLTKLFNKQGQANTFIFKQIPNVAIIEIVRPNWPIKNKIGTNLNVSHLGFAIRTPNGLVYRSASLIKKKVADIPLEKYLHRYIHSPTVKGISVFLLT